MLLVIATLHIIMTRIMKYITFKLCTLNTLLGGFSHWPILSRLPIKYTLSMNARSYPRILNSKACENPLLTAALSSGATSKSSFAHQLTTAQDLVW